MPGRRWQKCGHGLITWKSPKEVAAQRVPHFEQAKAITAFIQRFGTRVN
jgi:hypothetical protein